jgi:DNA-binding transcriptional LysR family regulator
VIDSLKQDVGAKSGDPRILAEGSVLVEHAFSTASASDWSSPRPAANIWQWSDPVAHGPTLNRASMLIDAAIDGQGVALARTALAAWDLINGRLVRPIDVSLRMSNTYWVVCPKATSGLPKIATFRNWLLAEAADDARRLKMRNRLTGLATGVQVTPTSPHRSIP